MSVQSFILQNYRSARTQSHGDMINKKKEKHRRIYSRQQSASHAKRKQKLKEVPCKLTPYRLAKHSAAEAEEPTRGRYPADGSQRVLCADITSQRTTFNPGFIRRI